MTEPLPSYGRRLTSGRPDHWHVVRVHSQLGASVLLSSDVRHGAAALYRELVDRGACVALCRGDRVAEIHGVGRSDLRFFPSIGRAIRQAEQDRSKTPLEAVTP